MATLDEWMKQSRDGREVKRGLCVKMVLSGVEGKKVAQLLGVSPAYVTHWKKSYEAGGVEALKLGYRGNPGLLCAVEKSAILRWLREQMEQNQPVSVEVLRAAIEARSGVLYRSRQSYYDLLHAARASYHKTQKQNPKRNPEQVQERREALKKTRFAPKSDSVG